MAKQVTLRIPRRRRRWKMYALSLLVAGVGFAAVYSLLTGRFRSSPPAAGEVTADRGDLDILRSGSLHTVPQGSTEAVRLADALSLDGGEASVRLEEGDRLRLEGRGVLSWKSPGEGRLEFRLEGLSLEGYFDKPGRRVKAAFLHVFPAAGARVEVSEESDGSVRVRCLHQEAEVGLPNGGTVRLDGGPGTNEGWQEVRLRMKPSGGVLRVEAAVRDLEQPVLLEVRDTGEKHRLHHTAAAHLAPGGYVEILRQGVRAPLSVAAEDEPGPSRPLVQPASYPAVPAAPDAPGTPEDEPRPGRPPPPAAPKDPPPPSVPADEPPPAAEPKDPPPPSVPADEPPPAAEPHDPPPPAAPDAEPGPGLSPAAGPSKPGKNDPAPPQDAAPARPSKPGKDAEPAAVERPRPVKQPKSGSRHGQAAGPPVKPSKPRPQPAAAPPAPPPRPLALRELWVMGKEGGVVVLRSGSRFTVPQGRVPLRSGDIIRVRRGSLARVNIGGGVIVTVHQNTEYRVP